MIRVNISGCANITKFSTPVQEYGENILWAGFNTLNPDTALIKMKITRYN
jgi:hypothetical protein